MLANPWLDTYHGLKIVFYIPVFSLALSLLKKKHLAIQSIQYNPIKYNKHVYFNNH
jgi:hypothetical protein